MLKIIIIIVVIGIIVEIIKAIFAGIFGGISNHPGIALGIGAVILYVFLSVVFGWGKVFLFTVRAVGVLLAVGVVGAAGIWIYHYIDTIIRRKNTSALVAELETKCGEYGCMTAEEWRSFLPSFVDRKYTQGDFDAITRSFAEKLEKLTFEDSDIWLQPYLKYMVEHNRATATKLFHEVERPVQFQRTHATPDKELLTKWLESGTKSPSVDVPPVFSTVGIEGGEPLYVMTEYGKRIYGAKRSSVAAAGNKQETAFGSEELDFNDL